MHTKPLSRLSAISFLQSFVTQSVKAANQLGCTACGDRLQVIEYVGLAASGCLEDACREQAGLTAGPLSSDQYADIIISLKNQIGGNFSRATSEPGVVRVVNTRCPFGDAVKEAPELCRMTSSVFGGIAARNMGYAKVELKRRIAAGDDMCEVCIHLDRNRAAGADGDEYHLEGDAIVSRSSCAEMTVRVEEKMRQAWCAVNREQGVAGVNVPKIVAESTAMRRALESVERVAPTAASVLISGETGVGKEIIARAVHALSGRCAKQLITVNCGAIPENLIESQLFGHERGAFTGAYQVHHGFFERAEKGTLFLDEINSLPLPAQARLLRVLQDGTYERVGGKQALRADVRIVAATNRHLDEMVAAGEFRRDLFFRINVVPIHIPPLRERKEDISALTDHVIRRLAEKYGTGARVLSERAWIQVMGYDWPGNVRELENVIERSFIFAKGQVIEEVLLKAPRSGQRETGAGENAVFRTIKRQAAKEVEDKLIRDALSRFGGNVTAVARGMGITPRAVHQKLRTHGIDAAAYRTGAKNRVPA
ncbi:MAG: sigma 54-interacting transcriptional regulator [Betaproteobacteria bacterium]|nr:sigma 54-interacting transcriptional regulator [Betaproteobacteria bacterium]